MRPDSLPETRFHMPEAAERGHHFRNLRHCIHSATRMRWVRVALAEIDNVFAEMV
jgi:hypothetical protein